MKRTIIFEFPDDVSFPETYTGNEFCEYNCPFNVHCEHDSNYCAISGFEHETNPCPFSKDDSLIKLVRWKKTDLLFQDAVCDPFNVHTIQSFTDASSAKIEQMRRAITKTAEEIHADLASGT